MYSNITVSNRLVQRFNLLSERAEESGFSIDGELLLTIQLNPEVELILNTNPNITSDPEKLYRKIVSALSVTFLEGDIQKIISTYCCGDTWKKWTESERKLFISENIKQQEVEKEQITELDKALDQVTGYKTEDFDRGRLERQQIKDILNSVSKVEIVKGVTNKDPGYWRIYITGDLIEIPAASLKKSSEFETMYFTKFGHYLPSVLTASKRGMKDTPWRIFLQTLRRRAIIVDPSESTEMIEIGIIIEKLVSYKTTEDPIEWIKASNVLLDVKEGYYLILPTRMKELIEDLHIKTELGKLSDIMSQLGMKKHGNPNKSVNGSKPRAWWFKKYFIDSHRNARPGDDCQ
jgi:hypothetical protein